MQNDVTANAHQVYLNGEKIPVVHSDNHLENFISTKIAYRNILLTAFVIYNYNTKQLCYW